MSRRSDESSQVFRGHGCGLSGRAAPVGGPSGRILAMISTNQILSAYRIIRPHIRRTPIVEVDGADFGIDTARLTLKLESLQHAGSFKARGAFTNLLTRSVPAVGVVAASGGNHGAAVAFAAMRRNVPAKIFVPNVASSAKIQQISAYGAPPPLEIAAAIERRRVVAPPRWRTGRRQWPPAEA